MSTSTIAVAGIDLEVYSSGEGVPLLWLHDLQGFNAADAFVRSMSSRRMVAPSHPGFGRSSLPDWVDSVDDIAHVYLELLDWLSIERCDLVGCCIGGWIAAEMVTKAPERFRKVVMVGPVGVKLGPPDKLDVPDIFAMSSDEVDRVLYHDAQRGKLDPSAFSDEPLAIKFRNRESLALLTWEPWMHNPKLRHRLHRAMMPALFIRGGSDRFVSEAYIEGYSKLLPDARIATISDAGHFPYLEQPERFVGAVKDFLEA